MFNSRYIRKKLNKTTYLLLLCIFASNLVLVTACSQSSKPSYEYQEVIELQYDDRYKLLGRQIEVLDSGEPVSYKVGYGVKDEVKDDAVITVTEKQIIASGIGEAYVKLNGVTHKIVVNPAPISLILLAGQSNMRGSEGDASQSIICESGKVYSTYAEPHEMTVDNATDYAVSALSGEGALINVNGTTQGISKHPIIALTEEGNGKIGADSGIGYEWYNLTGEKVWLVNVAHGGSSIKTWKRGGDNFEEARLMFSACQETLRKEIAAGHYILSYVGYFWCQGEAEATRTAEYYVTEFLSMHEYLKKDFAFDHDSNKNTGDRTFEFAGIIPVRSGSGNAPSYRQGEYLDVTEVKYFESFKDLCFTGPRVAQYWMGSNPELSDIHVVCNIGESWVTMPDGTDGVCAYFESRYRNGRVNYKTQAPQYIDWYTPLTPADVHDSIHYNQIGYNEIGMESARNMLYILEKVTPPDIEVSVKFLAWDGYTEVTQIDACPIPGSNTLVVPMVYPVWKSKQLAFNLTDGLSYKYYDLIAKNTKTQGVLTASITNSFVKVNAT